MKPFCSPRSTAFAVALAAFAALAVGPSVSRADSVYSLNNPNAALSAVTGPYGTIAVHLTDSTHATITFATADATKFRFGGAQAADFNTNGTTSVTSFSTVGGPGQDLTNAGPGNVSSFGNFSNTFDNFDGDAHTFTSATFNLTKTSGSWASDAVVMTENGDGVLGAAHIFAYSPTGTVIVTGFAGDGPLATPEFGSASLMGLMLLGFCGIAGFQRVRKPALV
jgi:hypothetical protein